MITHQFTRSSLRFKNIIRNAVLGGVLCLALPAFAQNAAPVTVDPDLVLVRIGDETITNADLSFAAEDLGQELANVPQDQVRAFLTSVLIDMKVMANAAREAKMSQSDVFKRRLAYLQDRALRRAYFTEVIAGKVNEASVQAAYDTYIADFTPEDEIRARHILVEDGEVIKAIKAEINDGRSFEDAAAEYSIDSSSQSGGDLGFFRKGMMVAPFEAAAFALEIGEVSEPVQSQFGWHLIKLEEQRQSEAPTLQQVGPQLEQQVLVEQFNSTILELKAGVSISFDDAELEAGVAAQAEAGN